MEDSDKTVPVPITNPPENDDGRAPGDLRDAKGRFIPGTKGGPGVPAGKRIDTLAREVSHVATMEERAAIIRKMIERAKEGSIAAASWVFDRIYGKPRQVVELSGSMDVNAHHPASMFDDLVAEVLRDSPQKRAEYAAMGFTVLASDGEEGN